MRSFNAYIGGREIRVDGIVARVREAHRRRGADRHRRRNRQKIGVGAKGEYCSRRAQFVHSPERLSK